MNDHEVRALRRAFDSVKERQALNSFKDFAQRKKRLILSREHCVGMKNYF